MNELKVTETKQRECGTVPVNLESEHAMQNRRIREQNRTLAEARLNSNQK